MGSSTHLGKVLPLASTSWCLILFFSAWVILLCEARRCMDGERRALTKFRNKLNDPFNRLSSWDHELDCCGWRGITCDNKTGYVIKLDLQNPYPVDWLPNPEIHNKYGYLNLSGELDQSLLELKHLKYVDFSFNSFDSNSIPAFLGSLSELRYLNLSYAGFQGIIPPQLGNLSKLENLDVSSGYGLAMDNIMWLGKLKSLKHFHMEGVDLSVAKIDWILALNQLPSLVELHLVFCELSHIPQTFPFLNFTSSLRVLDLSGNRFNSVIPSWIANLSNLVSLDLSWNFFSGPTTSLFLKREGRPWRKIKRINLSGNQIQGVIPESIGNLTSLTELDLSYTQINEINVPESLGSLQNLEMLDLSGNNINGEKLFVQLCKLKGLEHLYLRSCMLTGPLPPCLGQLSYLQMLDLSSNNLSGALPETLGRLSELRELHIENNSLTGVVSEMHFRNLSKLTYLFMSSNSLTLQFQKDWSPPFRLIKSYLRTCHLGPDFPSWLKSQKDSIKDLDISNSGISDEVPDWFWEFIPQISILMASNNKMWGNLPDPFMTTSSKMEFGAVVDLSLNLFSGPIPLMFGHFYHINLSGYKFSGSLPSQFGHANVTLNYFMASNNSINGTIPTSLEELEQLYLLDLSRNKLSGKIPKEIGNCTQLQMLDLSVNYLHGEIPRSVGHMQRLRILHLNKNKLSGCIPISLKRSLDLEAIDLGENNLLGKIPTWIGDLPYLRRLRLRSNFFYGEIPLQLSNASSLQVLDFAENMIRGLIPPSFGNLLAMKIQNYTYDTSDYDTGAFAFSESVYKGHGDNLLVSTKGQTLEYTTTLPLVTSLDLSNNNLGGNVPEELTRLVGLRILNLSRNQFTGKLSEKISNLNLLSSLDLSRNQFFGLIPQSLSYMTSLEHLNLSYNNLSGKIPTGPQLQVLDDPSSYIGNAQLCGPPLAKMCPGDIDLNHSDKTNSSNAEGEDMGWLYAGIGPGFAVGCSGILLILIFKESCRMVLFRFADALTAGFSPYA